MLCSPTRTASKSACSITYIRVNVESGGADRQIRISCRKSVNRISLRENLFSLWHRFSSSFIPIFLYNYNNIHRTRALVCALSLKIESGNFVDYFDFFVDFAGKKPNSCRSEFGQVTVILTKSVRQYDLQLGRYDHQVRQYDLMVSAISVR